MSATLTTTSTDAEVTYVSAHAHEWAVTDWLEYSDADRTFKGKTSFLPPTHNVVRHKALEATCLACGEKKLLDPPTEPSGDGS